jgi:hypothetical protein|tara:strand:- start:1746 stop:1859 length:114 start_codon:yes stop_codon:yes gene_type:complete
MGDHITLALIVLFIIFFPKLFIGTIAVIVAFFMGVTI